MSNLKRYIAAREKLEGQYVDGLISEAEYLQSQMWHIKKRLQAIRVEAERSIVIANQTLKTLETGAYVYTDKD